MPRKNTRRSDWVWVALKQKERANKGQETTFIFNGRKYSDDEIRKEIARKGIDTDLIFNKEMPEVPEGWTATTPPAKFVPYFSLPSPDSSWTIPMVFGAWANRIDLEEWADMHRIHVAETNDIQDFIRVYEWSIDPNPRCPKGLTPLDRAVNPRVREFLLSYGGRTTRIGSDEERILCNRKETLDRLKDLDKEYRHLAPSGEDFSIDEANSASAITAPMQMDPRESHLRDSLMSGRAIYASSFLARRPMQAPVHDAPNGPPCPKPSKITGGAADLSCSPMSWQNTTEAPTPEKRSPYPMSRYLGSSAGSAAISIRGSSYRSSYQNTSLRQTSFLRTAMLAKGSHGEQKLRKEDWEQHELWATPRLPTPKW